MIHSCQHINSPTVPPRIWQPCGLKCKKRKALAEEILQTPADDLEFNAKQLQHLCWDELQSISRDGRIPLKHTEQGSKVFAIVSGINSSLMADTQMVESINSIIKLISTRCPRIDLETLSARIVIKKSGSSAFAKNAVHVSYDEDRSIKKWSRLKHVLFPILEDCLGAANAYNEILNTKARFTPPLPIQNLSKLHLRLSNKALGLALPDLKANERWAWIVDCLREVSRAGSKWQEGRGSLQSACSLLALRTAPLFVPGFLTVQCGSHRSEGYLINVVFGSDGNITIPDDGRFEFQSLSSHLRKCAQIESCKTEKIDLQCASLVYFQGHFAPLLDSTKQCNFLTGLPDRCMPHAFQNLLSLDDEITHTKKHPIDNQSEIDQLAHLQAGYGFDDDVADSFDMTDKLQNELGEDETTASKRSAEIIKTTGILQHVSKGVLVRNIENFSLLFVC